jgi:hypothetical protein
MERSSHREYLLWKRHFKDEWNHPNRTDHYLMQIAREVKRVLSKKPAKIQLKHFLLDFNPKKKSQEEVGQQNKSYIKQYLAGVMENMKRRKGK